MKKGAKDYAQKLQVTNFDDNLEIINYGVKIMKVFGMLDSSEYASKALIEKIYNQILSLQEQGGQGSGFRASKFRSPTASATFLALETIVRLSSFPSFSFSLLAFSSPLLLPSLLLHLFLLLYFTPSLSFSSFLNLNKRKILGNWRSSRKR